METPLINRQEESKGEPRIREDEPPRLKSINYLNVVSYAANVAVTYGIGAAGLFGGKTNAELSEKYQTLVTPAGWAFAIWGVIFLFQAIFTLVQLLPSFRSAPMVLDGVRYYYAATCFFQVLWTLAFSNEIIWLSFIAMLLILVSLLSLLYSQYKTVSKGTLVEFWLLRFPFEIHAGWILAASVVNLNVFLLDLGASADVQLFSAYACLVVLILVALSSLCYVGITIPAVLVWATLAVAAELNHPKQSIKDVFDEHTIDMVKKGALVASTIVLISLVGELVFRLVRSQRTSV